MHAEKLTTALETVRAAALAGGILIAKRGRDIGDVRVKGAQTDVVTDTDIASGVAIIERITEIHPDARFVVEEEEVYDLTGAVRGSVSDNEVWVVDPLDGTTSFVHGFPCYSVSVALLRSGVPVAGAVYHIAAEEMFSAAVGMGATRDNAPVTCSTAATIPEALMVTGFPYDRGRPLDRQLAVLERFLRTPVHGLRRDGSAAIDCCHVACGRADGFWEYGLQPWDTAAGVVILREAGALITGIDGKPWTPTSYGVIAANPQLHTAMTSLIREAGPEQ